MTGWNFDFLPPVRTKLLVFDVHDFLNTAARTWYTLPCPLYATKSKTKSGNWSGVQLLHVQMQIRKEAYSSVTNKFVMKLTRNWQFFLKKNTLAVNSQKLLYMYMRTFIIIALYIMIRNETITRSSYHHSKGTTCRPHCSKFVVLGLKGEQKIKVAYM